MAIKLVALDLDGTTINNDRVISQRNRDAMTEAARRGVNIVVATGRPLGALPKDVFEIEGIRYALTSNGASITDIRENTTFYENCLSPAAVRAAVRLLQQYDYVLETFVDGVAYIEGWYYRQVEQTRQSFRGVDYILNTRHPVDDFYQFMLDNDHHLENINVNFEDLSEKPGMYEKLIRLPEATITSSFDHNLEIGGATTSKADALRHPTWDMAALTTSPCSWNQGRRWRSATLSRRSRRSPNTSPRPTTRTGWRTRSRNSCSPDQAQTKYVKLQAAAQKCAAVILFICRIRNKPRYLLDRK